MHRIRFVHFGDLHLRGRDELPVFERQLDRALAWNPHHIVISGDLVDRWSTSLLQGARRLLAERDLLDPSRLTIIHGNHDLASSGGWPRHRRDLSRLILRFWDPPPLLAWRRARFTRLFDPVAERLPFERTLSAGLRLLAIDSTPLPLLPFTLQEGTVWLRTALGILRDRDLQWLSTVTPAPSVLVLHHSPIRTSPLRWNNGRVLVPMHVEGDLDRFWKLAERAGVRLVLCGHVHRTLRERHGGVTIATQGQSGAEWAGRPFSVYDVSGDGSLEQALEI